MYLEYLRHGLNRLTTDWGRVQCVGEMYVRKIRQTTSNHEAFSQLVIWFHRTKIEIHVSP